MNAFRGFLFWFLIVLANGFFVMTTPFVEDPSVWGLLLWFFIGAVLAAILGFILGYRRPRLFWLAPVIMFFFLLVGIFAGMDIPNPTRWTFLYIIFVTGANLLGSLIGRRMSGAPTAAV